MSNFLNRIFFNFTPLKRSQKVQPSDYPSTIVYGNNMFTPYQIIIDTTDTLTLDQPTWFQKEEKTPLRASETLVTNMINVCTNV